MTHKEACEPCSKRKVRCDRAEPCSNCRRRKADRCVYLSVSPADRIRRLEALVRKLGGDPSNSPSQGNSSSSAAVSPLSSIIAQIHDSQSGDREPPAIRTTGEDSVVLEEDGQPFYLESRAWQSWLGGNNGDAATGLRSIGNPFLLRQRPDALAFMFDGRVSIDLATCHPPPTYANVLWAAFVERVDPLVRISYRWALSELRERSLDAQQQQQLSGPETALIFVIYLISIVSLPDDECERSLQEPKSRLLSHYHTFCEEALVRTNLFCMADINVIKAIILFTMASYERVSIQSLWSLLGLAIRNAEKMGMHRDGAALGLSAVETEHRRRVWWQLQHMDLCLGVWAGLTPMTLMAEWDAKIPSNIEDEDLGLTTVVMHPERKGSTSLMYCRYTYWVLEHQRQLFRTQQGGFRLSWQSNTSMPRDERESVVSQIEDGLNQNFIQYCDPLKPLDVFVQLSARFLIHGFRMRILHAASFSGNKQELGEEERAAILDSSIHCLRYHISIVSQPLLECFRWWNRGMFSWQALMFVLVEASREDDMRKSQEIWNLLSTLYAANPTLSEIFGDRRRLHAAELIIAAWKTSNMKFNDLHPEMPEFVATLQRMLATKHALDFGQGAEMRPQPQELQQAGMLTTPQNSMSEHDMGAIFDLDFSDIDWSYWNSMV